MGQDSRDVMRMAMQETFEHKRRVWQAREQVERLEHELALAKERLAVETQEYQMSGGFMREIWGYFKAEIEAMPEGAAPPNPSTANASEGASAGAQHEVAPSEGAGA